MDGAQCRAVRCITHKPTHAHAGSLPGTACAMSSIGPHCNGFLAEGFEICRATKQAPRMLGMSSSSWIEYYSCTAMQTCKEEARARTSGALVRTSGCSPGCRNTRLIENKIKMYFLFCHNRSVGL